MKLPQLGTPQADNLYHHQQQQQASDNPDQLQPGNVKHQQLQSPVTTPVLRFFDLHNKAVFLIITLNLVT